MYCQAQNDLFVFLFYADEDYIKSLNTSPTETQFFPIEIYYMYLVQFYSLKWVNLANSFWMLTLCQMYPTVVALPREVSSSPF